MGQKMTTQRHSSRDAQCGALIWGTSADPVWGDCISEQVFCSAFNFQHNNNTRAKMEGCKSMSGADFTFQPQQQVTVLGRCSISSTHSVFVLTDPPAPEPKPRSSSQSHKSKEKWTSCQELKVQLVTETVVLISCHVSPSSGGCSCEMFPKLPVTSM